MRKYVIIGIDSEESDERLLTFIGRALETVSDNVSLRMQFETKTYHYDKYGADGHHVGHTQALVEIAKEEAPSRGSVGLTEFSET